MLNSGNYYMNRGTSFRHFKREVYTIDISNRTCWRRNKPKRTRTCQIQGVRKNWTLLRRHWHIFLPSCHILKYRVEQNSIINKINYHICHLVLYSNSFENWATLPKLQKFNMCGCQLTPLVVKYLDPENYSEEKYNRRMKEEGTVNIFEKRLKMAKPNINVTYTIKCGTLVNNGTWNTLTTAAVAINGLRIVSGLRIVPSYSVSLSHSLARTSARPRRTRSLFPSFPE